MKPAKPYSLVLVTAPDLRTARKLTRAALKAGLVACGNLVPKLESHYWWQGQLATSAEVLILFKTTTTLLSRLEELILDQHPYDTPEIVALGLDQGTEKYLAWIQDSVGQGAGF